MAFIKQRQLPTPEVKRVGVQLLSRSSSGGAVRWPDRRRSLRGVKRLVCPREEVCALASPAAAFKEA